METLEILFNPITLCVIVFIAGLGFLASPYEIKYEEEEEDLMM